MHCLWVAPSGTLASPHSSVENGNGLKMIQIVTQVANLKVCLMYTFSLS